MLCIYERGRDSLRSVLMGKENVKHLLFNVEELMSKQSPGQFVRTYRVGGKVFILQLGSNALGSFIMISKHKWLPQRLHCGTRREIGLIISQLPVSASPCTEMVVSEVSQPDGTNSFYNLGTNLVLVW